MHRPHCAPLPLSFALRLLVVCLGVWATPARAQEPQASPESPERLEQACTGGNALACDTLGDLYDESNLEAARRTAEGTTLSLFFTLGGQGGGDALLEATYTDGSMRKLGAGDALTFATGVMMEPVGGTPHVLQLQANGGFNIMSIAGIFWSHWSWELLGFYAYKPFNLRIGGGFQYNTHLGLEGTGSFAGAKVPFDDSLGLLVQADWQFNFLSFYVRYTSVAFKPTGAPAGFPANSIGGGMSIVLKVL